MADERDSHIFAEDIVSLKESESSSRIGLVIRSGSNCDTSDDEEFEDDDYEDEDKVKVGELLVCWYPSGEEEVIAESKVTLTDRSLQPGDVIRHKNTQHTNQKGFITDIQISADVNILGTQLVVKDVDCKTYISPLQELSPWTRIAFGPWVGSIKNVYRRVTLWLKNGSRCCIEEDQLSMLYDIVEKRDEDSPFYNSAFFPSQSVVGPAKAFKEAKWLSKVKPILNDQHQVKAVVEESKVVKVDVEWQVCGTYPPGCIKEDCAKPPEETITEDKLHQIKIFQHYKQAEIQIGDKGYYIVKEEDVPVKNDQNEAESRTPDNMTTTENAHCADGSKKTNKKLDKGFGENEFGNDKEIKKKLKRKVQDDSLVEKATSVIDTTNSEIVVSSKGKQKLTDASTESSTTNDGNVAASVEEDDSKTGENAHVSESDEGDVESDGAEHTKQKTTKQDQSSKHSARRRRRRLRHRKKTQFTVKIKPGDKVCVEVIRTQSSADVMWQDGTVEKGVSTLDLIPSYYIDEYQFFPGFFVADKRACKVHWIWSTKMAVETFKYFTADDIALRYPVILKSVGTSLTHEPAMKATSAKERGLINLFLPESENKSPYGVVQFARHDDRTCQVKWFDKSGNEVMIEEDVSVYDIAEHTDFHFDPGDLVVGISGSNLVKEGETTQENHCVAGQVVRVNKDGRVVVAWVGQTTNQCSFKPQDLYKVESEDEDDDESDTNSEGSGHLPDDSDNDEWETASEVEDNEGIIEELIIGSPPPPDVVDDPGSPTVENVDIEALNNANNLATQLPAQESSKVEGFLMLSEAPVNHKFKEENVTFSPKNPRKFMSVLRKEMLLLQSSLPPGILIRGFEDSMHLFSVLIHGPADTPYEDGLFLFDLSLPVDYPDSPPLVFFQSYSENALNPNLYTDGTICISLLGTWNGKNNEVWTQKSNILQLLLSIQGLILCKEPYYNEAGYDKQRGTSEGKENARLYNEMTILQLIESMAKQMKTTHTVFDKEIKEHFTTSGQKIIKRFQSWISQSKKGDKDHSLQENSTKDNDSSSLSETLPPAVPEFPLFPLSRGFLICLERSSETLKHTLEGI